MLAERTRSVWKSAAALNKRFISFYVCECFARMHVRAPQKAEKSIVSIGTVVTGDSGLSCDCRELNPGCLQECQVFLPTEQTLEFCGVFCFFFSSKFLLLFLNQSSTGLLWSSVVQGQTVIGKSCD